MTEVGGRDTHVKSFTLVCIFCTGVHLFKQTKQKRNGGLVKTDFTEKPVNLL